MGSNLTGKMGITKIDLTIFFVTVAIIVVIAAPRYSRATKTDEAKSLILNMKSATDTVIGQFRSTSGETLTVQETPTDERWLDALKVHFNGSIPVNPFTNCNEVTLQHQRSLKPCDCLNPRGGWVWNLVLTSDGDGSVQSQVWLDSDTVHIGKGNGESCIQP